MKLEKMEALGEVSNDGYNTAHFNGMSSAHSSVYSTNLNRQVSVASHSSKHTEGEGMLKHYEYGKLQQTPGMGDSTVSTMALNS